MSSTAAPAPPPSEQPDGLPVPRRYVAAAAVLAAIVLAVLDGAIANVALPTIARELAVSASASVWVITAYQLPLVVSLLPSAALGESLGYRRVFVAGVLLFTLASAGCALSSSLPGLIVSRMVQGLGAAAIMSLLAALVRHTYPARLLGTAIGLSALFVALAGAAGPTLGAAILTVARWPWLFAVNLPVGALVLLASTALPRTPGSGKRLDLASVALNALVFAPLVLGADLLVRSTGYALALIGVAGFSAALLVRRERRQTAPLIPLDLLAEPTFRVSVVASICTFAAGTAALVALPFYLQHGLGRDAFTTGLYMTPWPLTVAVAAPLAGRFADRVPSALLCVFGGGCLAVGLALAAAWPLGRSLAPLVVFTVLCGLGFGFFQTPNNRNMLMSAPRARSGAAGGMQATARLTGQTAGAVLAALLFSVVPSDAPRVALAAGAGLAALAALVSTLRA